MAFWTFIASSVVIVFDENNYREPNHDQRGYIPRMMDTLVGMMWSGAMDMTRRTPTTYPLYTKIALFTVGEEWCSGNTLPTKPKVSIPHLKLLSPHYPLLVFCHGSRLRILLYKEPFFWSSASHLWQTSA